MQCHDNMVFGEVEGWVIQQFCIGGEGGWNDSEDHSHERFFVDVNRVDFGDIIVELAGIAFTLVMDKRLVEQEGLTEFGVGSKGVGPGNRRVCENVFCFIVRGSEPEFGRIVVAKINRGLGVGDSDIKTTGDVVNVCVRVVGKEARESVGSGKRHLLTEVTD